MLNDKGYLRHEVGAVESSSRWIDPGQLVLVIVHKLYGPLLEQRGGLLLVK